MASFRDPARTFEPIEVIDLSTISLSTSTTSNAQRSFAAPAPSDSVSGLPSFRVTFT